MTNAATAPAEPTYLKIAEVAERLNISLRHAYDLAASGELETYRFGTGRLGLRVTAASLADFEQRRKQQS